MIPRTFPSRSISTPLPSTEPYMSVVIYLIFESAYSITLVFDVTVPTAIESSIPSGAPSAMIGVPLSVGMVEFPSLAVA